MATVNSVDIITQSIKNALTDSHKIWTGREGGLNKAPLDILQAPIRDSTYEDLFY